MSDLKGQVEASFHLQSLPLLRWKWPEDRKWFSTQDKNLTGCHYYHHLLCFFSGKTGRNASKKFQPDLCRLWSICTRATLFPSLRLKSSIPDYWTESRWLAALGRWQLRRWRLLWSAGSQAEPKIVRGRSRSTGRTAQSERRGGGKKTTWCVSSYLTQMLTWTQKSSWWDVKLKPGPFNTKTKWFCNDTVTANGVFPHRGLLAGISPQASAEQCPELPTTSRLWPSSRGPGWTCAHTQ